MPSKEDIKLCIEELKSKGIYAYEHKGLVIVNIDELNESFILHDDEICSRAENARFCGIRA
ncbi:hypothetical protein HEE88_001269 [Campylobacter upsaliensis]|uniref:Uncharacterized protein n=1 Tax=Campylobacter vulpis TaxID=1655500 RepID=A0ABS5P4I4_9BACT|nr:MULTISPECIES: hypothetical protein [Campylobacter]ECP7515758.1 hypothetical protein [Campylobacter jejuni]EAH5200662.1 hypothetical protein [Campylobacter upsaliensis]EAH7597650.1 hypothetical protein [Campylobacter upsaliensis]EAI6143516.1 hypothetical protein [Campylobacter upsaliensis]EAI7278958.1 hypothetical protein [Campylobacter upsaliensis]